MQLGDLVRRQAFDDRQVQCLTLHAAELFEAALQVLGILPARNGVCGVIGDVTSRIVAVVGRGCHGVVGLPQAIECLVPHDAQQPRAYLRSPLEAAGLLPHFAKGVRNSFFGIGHIAQHTPSETHRRCRMTAVQLT